MVGEEIGLALACPHLVSILDARKARRLEASADFHGAWGFTNYEVAWLPPAVLAGMMFGLLILILILLKQRDSI